MSEVNPSDLRIIDSPDDVLETYQGAGDDSKTGLEIELAYFDPETPDLTPMSVPQNRVVKNAANEELGGDWVRNEPSSEMLEASTKAAGPDSLKAVLDDANQKIEVLSAKAAGIGLKRSYFQALPNKTAAELLQNIVDVPRYQAFFAPPRDDMMDIATYFTVCKSNQVSVSYRDPDHMLDNLRRLYFMAPFLFLLTDNSSGFDQGQRFPGHSAMHHRASLGNRGVYPDYLFTAKNGQDYVKSHIDHVMNNPLFVYYDTEGALQRLPSGEWVTFNSLREKGLNTATNYYFAESILWPDVKIAALKDTENQVVNHRYEARMFGVGIHQHQTAFLIVAGLAFNPAFAEKTDFLLRKSGFDSQNPEASRTNVENAYNAAKNHDGRFFETAYGEGQMIDFSTQFADLLEEAYADSGFEEALAPALTICRSGCSDGKVNRLLFGSLEKIIEQQRNFDPAIFDNPDQCAHMLYSEELGETSAQSCAQARI